MKNKPNGRNRVIGEVGYLETIGRDFVKSAQVLFEENNKKRGNGEYFNSINLLASQAAELLPKSLIATRIALTKNDESIEVIHRAIGKELGCLGHELDNIFNEVPELKKELNITKIERINNTTSEDVFIDEFRFAVEDESKKETVLCIKNLEAARYGIFARKKDTGGNFSKDIVNFLELLSQKIAELRASMINDFDKKNN